MQSSDLILHPDTTFHRVKDDKLQLRSPDGRHLTFQDDEKHVENILDKLRGGLSAEDIASLKADYSESFIEGVILPLEERGLIGPIKKWDEKTQYDRLLESYLLQGGMAHNVKLPCFVHIIGTGVLATKMRDIFKDSLAPRNRRASKDTLVIGVSDTCLLYTSPSPRDQRGSRMPSSA